VFKRIQHSHTSICNCNVLAACSTSLQWNKPLRWREYRWCRGMLNVGMQPWKWCPPSLWLCNIMSSLPVVNGQAVIRLPLFMGIKHFWSQIKRIVFPYMQRGPWMRASSFSPKQGRVVGSGFWHWCIRLRGTGVVTFSIVHYSKNLGTVFWKLDVFVLIWVRRHTM
jgi:hypothetical protein